MTSGFLQLESTLQFYSSEDEFWKKNTDKL
jgi:hypothetical protein